MNWITASTVMFIASAGLYLAVRSAQKYSIPVAINSLAMFLVPVPIYVLFAIATHTSFSLPLPHLVYLFFAALLFSWLGNMFSLRSVELAPNPGYPLIISKSYVIFSSIMSVFLFRAPLTLSDCIAIVMIIGFSTLLFKSGKKDGVTKQTTQWLTYALGAFFCWGLLALAYKFFVDLGIPVATRLLYMFSFVSIILLLEIRLKKISFNFEKKSIISLLSIGVAGAIFNLFMQLAYQTAPNPGYVNAVNAGSIVAVTVFATLLFKDEWNIKKAIGVIGVALGLILLFVR